MIPANAYRRNQNNNGWARIDMLLGLFDGAIERIDKALAKFRQCGRQAATTELARAQLLVGGLASGVNLDAGDQAAVEMLRLYEFTAHQLAHGNADGIAVARNCLDEVREGLRSIRDEAARLEREGAIPTADRTRLLEAVG